MVVPSPFPGPDKASLRRKLRDWRRNHAASLLPETRAALEAELARVLQPLLFAARVIAAYQPMKDEISPLAALEQARAMGKQTALPAFAARDSRMTFRGGEASEPGPWGLLQPSLTEPPLVPDLVLVPLVACDPLGNRIGMGQGHYDRALSALRPNARLVGLGWEEQLLDDMFEAEPWDQPLDAFASPAGLTEFAR
jgi:5-formyltetrahydrofolate cyclo-ligase